jgi:hypothetical protein
VNITICIPIRGSWKGGVGGRENKKETQALPYYKLQNDN